MNTTPDQPSNENTKCGRGWFHAGSMLLGFLLGAITINSASTLLQINKSRQTLELTNTGEKPVKIYHDAAAFWNSGELTIAPQPDNVLQLYRRRHDDRISGIGRTGDR